jgi:2-polyprenyl-3-methyl-5-hydroxy-6-metoxy-1,4-benzoquinol methylase
LSHQERIDKHFDEFAQHWRDLYEKRSLEGVIHQGRRSLALQWIWGLQLPSGARVLEVGCGAGLLAIELARHGYDVDCIDSSTAMVELAAAEASDADVAGRLAVDTGDVHALSFDSDAFDLVVALGVIPFLHAPLQALVEVARVARPGGWILFSSDNKYRLNKVLDPRYTPFPKREAAKRLLTGVGARTPSELPTKLFSYREIKRMTEGAGFSVERCETIGFGPFTFLGRNVLGEPSAIRLNNWLQERADRGTHALRSGAAQHLILAQRVRPRKCFSPATEVGRLCRPTSAAETRCSVHE